ncbi:hypothetical protein HNR40_002806 [Nonomuraea endophytica]|uniref:Uncharacterized protein n=1 Tax=Nonomuraea endophytica TaxID=714136 RepID=A0A7W8EFD9_9ACTN|nr:hypothetical protein [Nonomuraea endophytica]
MPIKPNISGQRPRPTPRPAVDTSRHHRRIHRHTLCLRHPHPPRPDISGHQSRPSKVGACRILSGSPP